jgi:ribosomal RNA-processing protein 12
MDQNLKMKKTKDPNRGFKTAADGRLIIKDIEDEETDSDDDDLTGYKEKEKSEIEKESSEDEKGPSSKKKQALNPYKAGGSGIHRPLAASVKSGISNYSRISKATTVSKAPGSEYKGKKASGDVKKKGKHEPYAYIQLSRNALNRRKRKNNGNQFKGVAQKSKKKGKKA